MPDSDELQQYMDKFVQAEVDALQADRIARLERRASIRRVHKDARDRRIPLRTAWREARMRESNSVAPPEPTEPPF